MMGGGRWAVGGGWWQLRPAYLADDAAHREGDERAEDLAGHADGQTGIGDGMDCR